MTMTERRPSDAPGLPARAVAPAPTFAAAALKSRQLLIAFVLALLIGLLLVWSVSLREIENDRAYRRADAEQRVQLKAQMYAESALKWVAVGMPVTEHPPHRSVRAELPHTAPASGHDAKRSDGYGCTRLG